jgi:hypothetical protein
MRWIFGLLCLSALGLLPLVGCSEGSGEGGSGGSGGTGGSTGQVFPCTEQGIRDAIAEGGGPHRFDCDGPQTVVTAAEIVIDNDVTLDGEGNFTVDGNSEHRLFSIPEGVTVELRGFGVTNGYKLLYSGGIRNEGTLTLTDSTVSGNDSFSGGIDNTGTLTLTNSTVSENTGDVGGIDNSGTLTLTNSTVSGNTGRGIFNASASTLTLTNSTVSGNTGGIGGGGIYNRGTLTLTNSTVSMNLAGGEGGGILNFGVATLTNTTLSDNTGIRAGGIYNYGTVTLANSTVSENTGDVGGGIYNRGTLTLTNSTVSGNTGGITGGGFYNYGTLTLVNVTVSGNEAEQGSGIANWEICAFSTCLTGTLDIRNTLVDGDCITEGDAMTTNNGYNIESPGNTCGFDTNKGDQFDVSAVQLNLGPLEDNGGPTMTHALGAGSVAIDQIPEADCVDAEGAPLTTDQRGEPRPAGSACDVGAFEVQP